MRLDWFLPAIRHEKPNTPPVRRNPLVRLAKRVLPEPLFSNWKTKRRGQIRRTLRKLGLSWLASPNRRIVQSLSFALFLLLFFWVCWPYSAQPAKSWSGWIPIDVDLETGNATLLNEGTSPLRSGETVYVTDQSAGREDANHVFGQFKIEQIANGKVQLAPVDSLDEPTRENLVLSS